MVRAATSATPMASASSGSFPSSNSNPRKGNPKPPSEKRLAANRANARKSTGPRTERGRMRARMNALRHGLCARVVLLPGEDWQEYNAFSREILEDLKPRGFMQEMLAGRVAALAWALQRLPLAAGELSERGENQRFTGWFNKRPFKTTHWYEAFDEYSGKTPRKTPKELEELVDLELMKAVVDGNPPPEHRMPAGMVADALAGDEAFAGLLKLEEHERRIWSGLMSALRALERRQKLDGRSEEERDAECEEEDGSRDASRGRSDSGAPDASEETPAPETPVPAEHIRACASLRTRLVGSVNTDAIEVANGNPIEAPARNEAIREDTMAVVPEDRAISEVPTCTADAGDSPQVESPAPPAQSHAGDDPPAVNQARWGTDELQITPCRDS